VFKKRVLRTCKKLRCRWEDNIRMDLREMGGKVWTRHNWLKTGTSGSVLGA